MHDYSTPRTYDSGTLVHIAHNDQEDKVGKFIEREGIAVIIKTTTTSYPLNLLLLVLWVFMGARPL